MISSDSDFLNWMADRLVNVYNEDPNVDFVHKLRSMAKEASEPALTIPPVPSQFDEPQWIKIPRPWWNFWSKPVFVYACLPLKCLLLSFALLCGCDQPDNQPKNVDYTVSVYGNEMVRQYRSSGKVEQRGDCWYFFDKRDGSLVRVSGTVTIDQAPKE